MKKTEITTCKSASRLWRNWWHPNREERPRWVGEGEIGQREERARWVGVGRWHGARVRSGGRKKKKWKGEEYRWLGLAASGGRGGRSWAVSCRGVQKIHQLAKPDPTRRNGSVFRAWWVGWGYKKKFYNEPGWVWVIKLQTRQTWPDPPIFNIYLKYIIYLIIFKNTSCKAVLPSFLLLILI